MTILEKIVDFLYDELDLPYDSNVFTIRGLQDNQSRCAVLQQSGETPKIKLVGALVEHQSAV